MSKTSQYKYKGVFSNSNQKSRSWRACLHVDGGKKQYLGNYPNEKQAAKACDWARHKKFGDDSGFNLGPLTEAEKGDTRTLEDILFQDCGRIPDRRHLKKPDATSKYKGVRFDETSRAWQAYFHVEGKKQHVGTYPNEDQAAKAWAWARFKLRGDDSGFNLGLLKEAEKSDARTLPEILFQDCGRIPDRRHLKKPGASSKYFGVSWDKSRQKWFLQLNHGEVRHSESYFHSQVEAAMAYDDLARSLKGEDALLNFKTPAEADDAIAAEAAASEGGASAESSDDESDDVVDEWPSSDEAADAEIIMPVSKRQRLSASPFPSPPTAPPGAIRSHTGWTSATPPTRATARPRSTTPPPPRLDRDAQWLDGSLTVDAPSLGDEPVFMGAKPDLQERFSISKPALEHLASLQRKLQAASCSASCTLQAALEHLASAAIPDSVGAAARAVCPARGHHAGALNVAR